MHFEWDSSKSERCFRLRGFDFAQASRIFEGRTVEATDDRRDYEERRVRAIGGVDGQIITVVYTDRDDVRRIISAWPANRKERQLWRW